VVLSSSSKFRKITKERRTEFRSESFSFRARWRFVIASKFRRNNVTRKTPGRHANRSIRTFIALVAANFWILSNKFRLHKWLPQGIRTSYIFVLSDEVAGGLLFAFFEVVYPYKYLFRKIKHHQPGTFVRRYMARNFIFTKNRSIYEMSVELSRPKIAIRKLRLYRVREKLDEDAL